METSICEFLQAKHKFAATATEAEIKKREGAVDHSLVFITSGYPYIKERVLSIQSTRYGKYNNPQFFEPPASYELG